MKAILISLTITLLCFCSPKGPQTYTSYYVGKNKSELILDKGKPKTIKEFEHSKAYIYKNIEEYYGKNGPKIDSQPKRTTITEHIYYVDTAGTVYKYQVWKKKVKK